MTADTEPPKRPRRRSTRTKRRCVREGCVRTVRPGERHTACSFLCDVVAQELERAQRLCEAMGGDTEHWLSVVALNDALSEYYRSDLRIYRTALSIGITDEQWQSIKRDRQ